MHKPPEILSRKIVASSRLFDIEEMHLQFSNGEQRHFEHITGRRNGGVLIIPMLDQQTILLVREYAAGLQDYEIAFPKGLIDDGEDALQAANRELKEEVGYGAKQLRLIKQMTVSPGYWGGLTEVILATDLYPEKLVGDEPESIEVIPWRLGDYRQLLSRDDFTEGRSIAALLLIKEMFD